MRSNDQQSPQRWNTRRRDTQKSSKKQRRTGQWTGRSHLVADGVGMAELWRGAIQVTAPQGHTVPDCAKFLNLKTGDDALSGCRPSKKVQRKR